MKQGCQPGIKKSRTLTVDSSRVVKHLGEGLGVYATPSMVADIESFCHSLLVDYLDEGEGSVGTHVDVKHLAATPEGMEVTLTAEITQLDRRLVTFHVEVHDPVEKVGVCEHSRFVVLLDMVKQRIGEKKSRAAE